MKNKGFTLIELLGVIIVLSLLLAIVVPKITSSIKTKQKDIDKTTEKLIYSATELYLSDSSINYPKINNISYCIKVNDLISLGYLEEQEDLDDLTIKATYNNSFKYSLVSENECDSSSIWLVKNISYLANYQEYIVPVSGYYKVELWGAQGGSLTAKGGKGAYTKGVIYLEKDAKVYVYTGGKGGENSSVTNVGGYNGGGYSGNNSGANSTGGGGSTDMRLVKGTWNDSKSLKSRIMVAAGGGGVQSKSTTAGGNGGGLIGENGSTSQTDYNTSTYTTGGATQTKAGASYESTRSGAFGYAIQSNTSGYGGGGGGGYYGGSNGYGQTGSSGSSFISGYAGVNAIESETSLTPTNNTLHYSGYYFIDGNMQAGVNEGNGKAKITFMGTAYTRKNAKLNGIRYIKSCTNTNTSNIGNHTVELQAIYKGKNIAYGLTPTESHGYKENSDRPYKNATDGDIYDNIVTNYQYASSNESGGKEFCLVIDLGKRYNLDEVAVWHYYLDGRTYKDNITSVSGDNANWTNVIAYDDAETSLGRRVSAYQPENFDYTGDVQTWKVPATGYYKVELWGAEGGTANSGYPAGKGAYTVGTIYLQKNEMYYIYVGGKGTKTGGSKGETAAGGYNGGGSGSNNGSGDSRYAGSGGGATDFRLVKSTWNNTNSLKSRIMVAGGGGGSWYHGNAYYGPGGAGGDLIAPGTTSKNSSATVSVSATTQTLTGKTSSDKGSFGIGANATSGSERPGAGGGYYGGSTGTFTATGGSSFISGYAGVNAITNSSTITHSNNTLHYSGKYFLNGNMKSGVNSGNGRARITYVGTNLDRKTTINNNTKPLDNVRYIKDCTTGSTANTGNHTVEMQAIYKGKNIAYGLIPTESHGYKENSDRPYKNATDGDIYDNIVTNYQYASSNESGGKEFCLVIDLGKTYELDEIAVWHYYLDGRTYNSHSTYVSKDNSTWNTVMTGAYKETSNGRRISAYE